MTIWVAAAMTVYTGWRYYVDGRRRCSLVRVEIVAVGTELLLGQIPDTNSQWLGERLAANGIASHFHQHVGDNHERIVLGVSHRARAQRRGHRLRRARTHPGRHHARRPRRDHGRGAGAPRRDRREDPLDVRLARTRRCPRTTCSRPTCRVGATVIEQVRGTAPGLICPVGTQGGVRGARRALRDERHVRARDPARPARAPARPGCRRRSS